MGSISGRGTATATSTGTLPGVTAGAHALVATAISSGISVATATTFTVASTLPHCLRIIVTEGGVLPHNQCYRRERLPED